MYVFTPAGIPLARPLVTANPKGILANAMASCTAILFLNESISFFTSLTVRVNSLAARLKLSTVPFKSAIVPFIPSNALGNFSSINPLPIRPAAASPAPPTSNLLRLPKLNAFVTPSINFASRSSAFLRVSSESFSDFKSSNSRCLFVYSYCSSAIPCACFSITL